MSSFVASGHPCRYDSGVFLRRSASGAGWPLSWALARLIWIEQSLLAVELVARTRASCATRGESRAVSSISQRQRRGRASQSERDALVGELGDGGQHAQARASVLRRWRKTDLVRGSQPRVG